MEFWKKKKPFSTLQLGLDLKRCTECPGPERPCLVDGKPATFHRWGEEARVLFRVDCFLRPDEMGLLRRRFDESGVVPHGCSTETIRELFALIEYPDGSVGKVKPELVTFLDRGHVD